MIVEHIFYITLTLSTAFSGIKLWQKQTALSLNEQRHFQKIVKSSQLKNQFIPIW